MLNENIKNLRKARGLSQEALSIKLNVVRQTVAKWEKGLSVPDAGMLIKIAEALDASVNVLLGEMDGGETEEQDCLKVLSAGLELLNEQYAKQNERSRKIWRTIFMITLILASVVLIRYLLFFMMVGGFWGNSSGGSTTVTVIGGGDVPAYIYALGFSITRLLPVLIMLLIEVGSIVGLYHTRKR
ncbi:MAG: helix-turn-helix transcriptional regulator [Lachnospiraceae bacterium]|nr:helix-turn-helix transcriptional regulator [Lachnospiraceae bacterium]